MKGERERERKQINHQLTAGRTETSVTSLLGLLVTTTAEVISAGVDDQGALVVLLVYFFSFTNSGLF
jgi:hypothetical protein